MFSSVGSVSRQQNHLLEDVMSSVYLLFPFDIEFGWLPCCIMISLVVIYETGRLNVYQQRSNTDRKYFHSDLFLVDHFVSAASLSVNCQQ